MGRDTRMMTRCRIGLRLLLLLGMASSAHAYDFVPTEAEWQAWPQFCQARYVMVPPGDASEFRDRVTPESIQQWSGVLGTCFSGVHHYCAGLAKFGRAGATLKDRDFTLQQAVNEHVYVRNTCPRNNPFWSDNESHMAMVLWEAGAKRQAMEAVDLAIKAHPTYDGAYIAKSILLKRAGQVSESRKVLVEGNGATKGESAELQYALGLSYLDAKQYEQAREHATKAYELGYPLPGLRDKLKAAGYPL